MAALVVDDDPVVGFFITELLEGMDIEVTSATSGEEAVDYIQSLKKEVPELVILDLTLPGIDGFETGAQIKAVAGSRHVPIIFLTANDEPGILSKCLAIGDDFISKPCSAEILTAKVEAHRRTAQLYRQLDTQYRDLKRYNTQIAIEHQMVDTIFSRHLEKNITPAENLHYHISPKSVFNGDILLASYGPAGNLYVFIGDVTGHGLPAAVGAMPLYPAFSAMTSKGLSVGVIAAEFNKILNSTLPDNMMIAASLLELNSTGERLTVWSGGLPAAILADEKGQIKTLIEPFHCPLGMLREDEFVQDIKIYNVQNNESVYLITDGIEESRNDSGEMFGEERLHAVFNGNQADAYHAVLESLKEFTGGVEQDDDITLVALDCVPTPESVFISDKVVSDALPWSVNFHLEARDLRGLSPIPQIIRMLSNAVGIDVHQDFISTILSELYANALEHGLLKLDSSIKDKDDDGFIEYYRLRKERLDTLEEGFIDINLSLVHDPDASKIVIKVTDSGEGFNTKLEAAASNDALHGRGGAIISELCQSLVYSENGRCVTATYHL